MVWTKVKENNTENFLSHLFTKKKTFEIMIPNFPHILPLLLALLSYGAAEYTKVSSSCVSHDDCAEQESCQRAKCLNPCIGACGEHSECQVMDHVAQCCCKAGFIGDAFTGCVAQPPFLSGNAQVTNACRPFPCGPNAQRTQSYVAAYCTCREGFVGDPYISCSPGCALNEDCPRDQECAQKEQECRDPCLASNCAPNTTCVSSNHKAKCQCLPNYFGDPAIGCYQLSNALAPSQVPSAPVSVPIKAVQVTDTAQCKDHEDCPENRVCGSGQCGNPCSGGFCHETSQCTVIAHSISCTCAAGYEENPYTGGCIKLPEKSQGLSCPPPESIHPCMCAIRGGGVGQGQGQIQGSDGNKRNRGRGILACSDSNLSPESISRAVQAFQKLNNSTKIIMILH